MKRNLTTRALMIDASYDEKLKILYLKVFGLFSYGESYHNSESIDDVVQWLFDVLKYCNLL